MHYTEIEKNLNALNAASTPQKTKTTKKKSAAPAGIATVFVQDELHLRTIMRVVKALKLESKGITPEVLMAGVKQHEAVAA